MQLAENGIDIFYIDESNDHNSYVVSAVTVPFLRNIDGVWSITWPDHLDSAKRWRRSIRDGLKIPTNKELHGTKLASGRGYFLKGKFNFPKSKSGAIYRKVLSSLTNVIPESSIITVAARRGSRQLYGHSRLEAAMYALLQRMRSQCANRRTNGLVFFDEGHPEYRRLYRQSQIFLPTGSILGPQMSRNIPLDMFTKDGNNKNSKFCLFTQIADLVAYAAFLKIKHENNELEMWQSEYSYGNIYESIPENVLNLRASNARPRDGIVRLH